MQSIACRLLGFVALLAAACALPAAAAPSHISATLVAESSALPGQQVTLAVLMRPAAGWHGYWLTPGDAGLPLMLDWSLPRGASAGPLQYPVPGTLLVSGLMNHVYEHDYAVLVTLTLPKDAVPGSTLPIKAAARWLACTEEVCVPEQGELSLLLKVGAPGPRDPRFDGWRAAMPAPLGSAAKFEIVGERLRLAVPLPAEATLQGPHLFVSTEGVADYAGVQTFSRDGDLLTIELPRAKFEPQAPKALEAVLRFDPAGNGVSITASPGAVAAGGQPLSSVPATPEMTWLLASALLGGLLLNIMPCVFPILSLKALSLARAGESEQQARSEGLAYTAGVVLACLVLGALLLALRAGGEQVGWAFQLQEPLVVAALLLLAVTITANLAGLFEFAVPGFADTGSRNGAFATGLLAAFAATPCTGPFMAAAMGAALLLPVWQALALFGTLGLGLALPFLLLAYVPALRRLLPKPGAWMSWFRKAMALPMGLTALALVWLASRVGGQWFAETLAIMCLFLVLGLGAIGTKQRSGKSALALSLSGLCLIVVLFIHPTFLPRTISSNLAETGGILRTQPYSEAALAKARASGKPVFLYFTADWCLTCKVNEAAAIEREDTRAAFEKAGVVVLRGDWTRRDPAISRFLSAQGAAGVPLYLWYPAGGGAPQQLPQVLTTALLAGLARAR